MLGRATSLPRRVRVRLRQCELVHTARAAQALINIVMRDHVLLFCLLALVLMAAVVLIIAPGSVTWALSLIE
jgi:hypothetical protein